MPYRRLPNTDSARFKALMCAQIKGKELPPFKLAFSQATLRKVLGFIPQYEKSMLEFKGTYSNQVKKNKEYIMVLKRAKLYISHFIQVLNMGIIRGELPPSTKKYFLLEDGENKVPVLNTEQSVIDWGERIIKGETQRKAEGLAPITNPSIALVMVRYEKFLDAYKFQKTLQKDNKRALDKLTDLRKEADEIIVNIWNEVEETFKDLPDDVKRENSAEYGLVFVYRKNEIKKINFFDTQQLSLQL